jgi:hypothetical protein
MTDRTKDAVYQAIRRDYRSRLADLSRSLDKQGELAAQLAEVNQHIVNTRMAVTQLDGFAYTMGWSPRDLGA